MTIWITKERPSNDPKFHQYEILAGVGRSTSTPLTTFNKGWVFILDVTIISTPVCRVSDAFRSGLK